MNRNNKTSRKLLPRQLQRLWFVVAAVAASLLVKPVGEARAQVSIPSMYDSEDADANTAPASGAASGQPRASLWDPLTQAWNRFQTQLDNHGIQFGLLYDGAVFTDMSGGLRRGATYLGNLNLQLTLDSQRLIGWPGATAFLYGLQVHGGHPSKLVGDAQGVSEIEAPAGWRLEEAWIQQNLFSDRLSALIGRYDLNSEFYLLQSAALFINSSFGIGPEFSQSGQEGPSIFPNTSVGARVEIKPVEELILRMAVLDGVPVNRPDGSRQVFAKGDGALVVSEAAYLNRPLQTAQPRTRQFRIGRNCCGAYTGKFAFGAWYYTARFDDLKKTQPDGQPVQHHGSRGFYLLGDQAVYQDSQNSDRQLNLFGQFGIGDPRVNRFAYYTGGGLNFAGLIPGRGKDQLGLAVAAAHNGNQFIQAQRNQGMRNERSEVAVELTYLAQFGSHLAVQPDLQFVINPNTDPGIKNAVAFTLRFEVSF